MQTKGSPALSCPRCRGVWSGSRDQCTACGVTWQALQTRRDFDRAWGSWEGERVLGRSGVLTPNEQREAIGLPPLDRTRFADPDRWVEEALHI